MNIGSFIGYNILFMFAFSAIYLIAREIMRVNKTDRIWLIWITGFAIGGFMIALDQTMLFQEPVTKALFNPMIISMLFVATYLDIRIFIGSLPFVIGTVFIGTEISTNIFMELIPIGTMIISTALINQLNVVKRNGFALIFNFVFMALGTVLFEILWAHFGPSVPGQEIKYAARMFAALGYVAASSSVQYGPIYLFNRAYRNFFSLEIAEKQDELGFIKQAVSNEVFDLWTDQERVTMGLFISFRGEGEIKQLKKDILSIEPKTMFFNQTPETMGMLVSIKISEASIVKGILRKIEWTFDTNFHEYKAGASLFGGDSVIYAELSQQSQFMMNKFEGNHIKLYSFKNSKDELVKKERIVLDSAYSTQTSISYINSVTTSVNTFIPIYKNENFEKFEEYLVENSSRKRHNILSMLSLKILKENDNDGMIVIPYSIDLMEVETFIDKVVKYIDPSRLIISVYKEDIKDTKTNKRKVEILRASGIKISINNFKTLDKSVIKMFKPEYIQSIKKRTIRDPNSVLKEMLKKVQEISPNTIELG